MTIEAIQFIDAGATAADLSAGSREATPGDFSNWLESELNALNNQLHSVEKTVQQFAAGEIDNLHQIMLSLEKTKLSFNLMLQVRNKLLEGYQEVMRMRV